MTASALRFAESSGLAELQTGGSFGQDSPLLAESLFSWLYMVSEWSLSFQDLSAKHFLQNAPAVQWLSCRDKISLVLSLRMAGFHALANVAIFATTAISSIRQTILSKVVYILDRFAASNSLYSTWIDDCPYPCKIVEGQAQAWKVPDDAGLVVTHEHFRWETISTLRRIYEEAKVPILILCDGILEFRNTWENPTIADGSVYQTIFGHKIACIGRAPARIIESFGNQGLCEIVGHPRFDEMYTAEHLPVQDSGPFRLLVTTARTPAFTEQQHGQVVKGLTELKNRFTRNNCVGKRFVEVNWRLPDSLLNELNLPISDQNHKLPSLGDTIEFSDAVITTPSTVFLESLIKRRPVALLDFTNSPAYVPAAWRITATAHMNPVLEELASPPATKMLFQRATLHDQLELGQDSRKRLFSLFGEMIDAGQRALETGKKLSLPVRILSDPQRGIAKIEDKFDLSVLFPNSPVFKESNVAQLQQELVHAIARLEQLPRELHDRDEKILKKSEHISSMSQTLQDSEARLEYANQRVEKAAERRQELMDAFEKQREQIEKKSAHIDRLAALLEEAHEQLKVTRSHFHKRANAMLAAAATLTKEVRLSRLESQPVDAAEAESTEQPEVEQATPTPDFENTEQPSNEPEETSGETSTGWPEESDIK